MTMKRREMKEKEREREDTKDEYWVRHGRIEFLPFRIMKADSPTPFNSHLPFQKDANGERNERKVEKMKKDRENRK